MARSLDDIGDEDYLVDLIKNTYGLRLYVKIAYFSDRIYVSETNTRECRVHVYSYSITEEQFLARIMKDFLFS
jgi:hypothetical protein